jgi:hypothetical protein
MITIYSWEASAQTGRELLRRQHNRSKNVWFVVKGGGAENNDVCGCVGMLLVSRFLYISSLRTLGSLHDLKLNHLSFLQGAITVSNNRGIMNEDVGTILAPNESVAFRVIEPFHRAAQTLTLPQQMFHFLVLARSLAERGRQSTFESYQVRCWAIALLDPRDIKRSASRISTTIFA